MSAPGRHVYRRSFRTFGICIGAGLALGGMPAFGALMIVLALILAHFLE